MNLSKQLYLYMVLILLSNVSFAQVEQNSARIYIGLNDLWTFSKDEKSWEKTNLPHTWNAKDVMDDTLGYYRGIGVYKRILEVSPYLKGKELFLCFNGVNQEAEVYINGKLAGKHIGGYTKFIVPVSKLLNEAPGFRNELIVKVNNRYNEDIPPLTADFTFFGGVYRTVGLLATNSAHFFTGDHGSEGLYISTPTVSAEKASVKIRALLTNASGVTQKLKLKTTLYNPKGKIVSTRLVPLNLKVAVNETINQDLDIVSEPELWSPESPALYRVVCSIIDPKNATVIDEVSSAIGFRWFKFDAEKGFFLNGQPLKLMGSSRHQDFEGLGNAVPQALQVKDVALLKAMGGNFLRVAHYPQDPVILETCDRLGILASVEIPVVNEITESLAFTENCKTMQLEMIRQNFNHPSVIMWAYMNEVLLRPRFGNDKARQEQYFSHIRELAQTLEDLTRKEDRSRYTMMALHGDFERYHRVGLTRIPMVIGWNLYQGWYGGELSGFGQFLDKHRKELPDKPLLVTEFGADADPRIRSFSPIRFDKSVEYAMKFSQVYLNEMLKRPFVSGGMVWNLADFNSESREETMPHINNKGLLTLGRKPKDTWYLYQAYLLDRPFIKIASRNWDQRTGVADSLQSYCTQSVQIATNLPTVELFLNGKSLGVKNSVDHVCNWDVPFVNGMNALRASDPKQRFLSDQVDIYFNVLPNSFAEGIEFKPLHILLGSRRYFIDNEQQTLWIPDQPYHKGAWGHIGGAAFKGGNSRITYGSDKNILNTELDPIYQTQQVDIKAYKFDLPNGYYQLDLYFAELMGGASRESLAYNLDNQVVKEGLEQQRIFDLNINGIKFLENFNIAQMHGYTTAVHKTVKVEVKGGQGIVLDFIPLQGQPILNALSVRKIN
jgi:beta-galactosidase